MLRRICHNTLLTNSLSRISSSSSSSFFFNFRFCVTGTTTTTTPLPTPPATYSPPSQETEKTVSSSVSSSSPNIITRKNIKKQYSSLPTTKKQQHEKNKKILSPGLASGAVTSSSSSIIKKSSSSSSILSSRAAGVPPSASQKSSTTKNLRGLLKSRHPSLTPAAARAAAAHLRAIREARARAAARNLKISLKKDKIENQPDFETGRNVKGLWGIYLRFLNQRPILAVWITSLLLWAIGDCTAQAIERKLHAKNVDEAVDILDQEEEMKKHHSSSSSGNFKWGRFFGALFDGSLIAGVGGHFWYQALDKFVKKTCLLRSGTFAFVSTKILFEFLIWHPVNLVSFWLVVGLAEGDSFMSILREFRDDFLPTLAGEYMLWGPLDLLSFRFVPVHLQVILMNVGCFFESVFLSYVRACGMKSLGITAPGIGDSMEDRGSPISIVDVLRQTDVPFERALRDAANRFCELDEDKGYITASDIIRYLGDSFDADGTVADESRLLPGVPSLRATEASGQLLLKHCKKTHKITRREYLRFIAELNHCAYRISSLPEVVFTLFDKERHMISYDSFIEMAQMFYSDTEEGQKTLQLFIPILETTIGEKELTVSEAKELLHAIDTLAHLHKGDASSTTDDDVMAKARLLK